MGQLGSDMEAMNRIIPASRQLDSSFFAMPGLLHRESVWDVFRLDSRLRQILRGCFYSRGLGREEYRIMCSRFNPASRI